MSDPAPFLQRWPWPDGTPITQEFGDMFSGYAHRGRDAGCPVGTPIVAEAPATVVPCMNDGSFGIAVCLDYGNGLFGMHAHNSVAKVAIGDRVTPGQLIALSGNTGMSTGPHCHFQLCVNTRFPTDLSYSRDPRLFMEEPMTTAERTLLACAAGDYTRMKAVYQALVTRGIIDEVALGGVVPAGAEDLNAAEMRRWRLVEVAAANAEAAYAVIK